MEIHTLDTTEKLARKLHVKLNDAYISIYLRNRYRRGNISDNWSGILSALQWIQVGEKAINSIKFDLTSYDADAEGFKFYSLVQAGAMVVDAINRLDEIIVEERKNEPFYGESRVFKRKVDFMDQKDDNHYFRAIRTCFGAHPVTIKLLGNDGKGHLFYSSWPYLTESLWEQKSDFHVSLWPKNPNEFKGKEQIQFFVRVSEVFEYIQQRYNYLNYLNEYIDQKYEEELQLKRTPIEFADENLKKNLRQLRKESESRNKYLYECIEELVLITRGKAEDVGESNLRVIEKYSELAKPIAELIRKELELNNQYTDYESSDMKAIFDFLDPDTFDRKLGQMYHYQVSKLSDAFHDRPTRLLSDFDYPIYDLKNAYPTIDFDNVKTIKGLYILVKASECIADCEKN